MHHHQPGAPALPLSDFLCGTRVEVEVSRCSNSTDPEPEPEPFEMLSYSKYLLEDPLKVKKRELAMTLNGSCWLRLRLRLRLGLGLAMAF